MPRLIVHDAALHDLDEAMDFIAIDSVDAAIRLHQAAKEAFAKLAEFPGFGGKHPTGNPAFEVLRVIHGARDVNRVFR
jgi:plasmid stabilization system protein ParE